MSIVAFLRNAISTAPTAALLPIAVAGGILGVVCLAILCQVSLRVRYGAFRRLTFRISQRLAASPPIEVRAAVKETVGQTSKGFGAIISDMINSAATRRRSFRPDAATDVIDDGENQIFRAAFVRWVSSAALIMGLAGTFVAFVQLIAGSGLIQALSTLSRAAKTDAVTPDLTDPYVQLSDAFANVYHALGYAFLSSLAGLLGILVLGFVGTIWVQPSKARALLALERFAEGLYAMVAPSTDESEQLVAALTTAATSMQSSGQTIESLRQTSGFLELAARRFESAEQTNAKMASTLIALTTEIEASHQKWDLLVESLRESKQQAADIMKAFKNETTQQREKTHSAVAVAVSEMREITKILGEEIRKISAAKMDQLISIQENFQQTLAESKGSWEKAGAEMVAQTSGAFGKALATVSEMAVAARGDAAETHRNVVELARNNMEAISAIIADTRGDSAKTQQEIAGLSERATNVVTHHEAILATHAEAVTASLQQWSGAPAALEQTLAASTRAVENLTVALDRMGEMPAQWEQNVISSIRSLEAQLNGARAREEVRSRSVARWFTRFFKISAWNPEK
jgi:hypothetical protein